MARIELKALPPAEAVRYFRQKGFKVAFDWRDVWQGEHARAFTVAKSMRLDVLRDIRGVLDSALSEGKTYRQFADELTPQLQAKGWWGKQTLTDPKTGEPRLVQLGSPRRLRIIYDVNMRTAHAAGAWERMQRTKKRRPFLRYSAVLDERTRPDHRAWHGTVLEADDPWWNTHYPPNGWRCRCIAVQMSRRDLRRFRHKVSRSPKVKRRRYRNKRTGETHMVPEGIDPGFGYNVGKAHIRAVRRLEIEKMEGLPDDLVRGAIRVRLAEADAADFLRGRRPGTIPVGVLPQSLADALGARARVVGLSDATAAKQTKHAIAPADYQLVQRAIDSGEVVQEGPRHLALVVRGTESTGPFRAVVKSNAAGDELYLISFRRTNDAQRLKFRRRGDILREEE